MARDHGLIIKEIIFIILLATGNALTIAAFSARDKEGMLLFFLGIIILSCTLCISGIICLVRHVYNIPVHHALIGLFGGGIIGGAGLLKGLFFFLAYEAEGVTGIIIGGGIGALIGALFGLHAHIRGKHKSTTDDSVQSPSRRRPKDE